MVSSTSPIFVRYSNATLNEVTLDNTDSYVLSDAEKLVGPTSTLTGTDLAIPTVGAGASIDYTFSAFESFETTLTSPWNSVKNIEVFNSDAADVVINNFVHTNISLASDNDSTVLINDAKRGIIETGDGNDTVTINAFVNDSGWDATFFVKTNEGSDTITVNGDSNLSNAVIDAGQDDDYIDVGPGFASTKIFGDKGNDYIDGSNANDTIYGGKDEDTIIGNDGNDLIMAGKENDSVTGGAGDDEIHGNKGADWINGNDDDDTIIGGKSNDTLLGGKGNDYIQGDKGNDIIIGGKESDTLTGGKDDDSFVFTALDHSTSSDADYITDFDQADDIIDLAGLGFTGIAAGAAAGTELGFSFDGTTTVIEDTADFKIVLEGNITLDGSDFVFI